MAATIQTHETIGETIAPDHDDDDIKKEIDEDAQTLSFAILNNAKVTDTRLPPAAASEAAFLRSSERINSLFELRLPPPSSSSSSSLRSTKASQSIQELRRLWNESGKKSDCTNSLNEFSLSSKQNEFLAQIGSHHHHHHNHHQRSKSISSFTRTQSSSDHRPHVLNQISPTRSTSSTRCASASSSTASNVSSRCSSIDGHSSCLLYVCRACNARFVQRAHFQLHSRNHHPHVAVDLTELSSTNIPENLIGLRLGGDHHDHDHPYRQPQQQQSSVQTKTNCSFQCTKCKQSCTDLQSLHQHIMTCIDLVEFLRSHSQKSFTDLNSTSSFKSSNNGSSHPASSNPPSLRLFNTLKSLNSNESASRKAAAAVAAAAKKRAVTTAKRPVAVNIPRYTCSMCNHTFSSAKLMKRHRFACLAKRRAAQRAFAANKSTAPVQFQTINKLENGSNQSDIVLSRKQQEEEKEEREDEKKKLTNETALLDSSEPLRQGAYPKRCAGCNRRFMYTLNFFKHIKVCKEIDRSKPMSAQVVLSSSTSSNTTTINKSSTTEDDEGKAKLDFNSEAARTTSTLRKRQPPASFNNYTMEVKRKRPQIVSLSELIRKDNEKGIRPGSYRKRCSGCNRLFMYRLNYFKHIRICSKNSNDPSKVVNKMENRPTSNKRIMIKPVIDSPSIKARKTSTNDDDDDDDLPPTLIPLKEIHLLVTGEYGDELDDNSTDDLPRLFSFNSNNLQSDKKIFSKTTTSVEKENSVQESNQSPTLILKLSTKTSLMDSDNRRSFTYLCKVCERGFIYKASFDKHVKEHRQSESKMTSEEKTTSRMTIQDSTSVQERTLRKKPESEKPSPLAASPEKVVPKIKIVTSPVVGGQSHHTLNHVVISADNSSSKLSTNVTTDSTRTTPTKKPMIKLVYSKKDLNIVNGTCSVPSSPDTSSVPSSSSDSHVSKNKEPLFKTTTLDKEGIRLLITSQRRRIQNSIMHCEYCGTGYRYAQSLFKHQTNCHRRSKQFVEEDSQADFSSDQSFDDTSEENFTAKVNEPQVLTDCNRQDSKMMMTTTTSVNGSTAVAETDGTSLLEKNKNHSDKNGDLSNTSTMSSNNPNHKFIQSLKQNILGLQKRISLALKNTEKEQEEARCSEVE